VTGSVGLSASALNTALEPLTSVILWFAVKKAEKPPDEGHPYGHRKVEALAAVVELILLFVVVGWIALQASINLLRGEAVINYPLLAVGINLISIIMDFYAFRRLKATSTTYESEAFAAGALHFISDGLIAVVAIVGVMLYSFGLWYADALAAFAVCGLILLSGVDVMKRTSETLLDGAPSGIVAALNDEVKKVHEVRGVHRLRVRKSGKKFFVDMHIEVDGELSLDEAHKVCTTIEKRVREILPDSDVTVHAEPHL
ncbi:MAG: cation diffusion facilitator family transporter, partial [Candidatus Bathyarchaeia archaeon]